MPTPGLPLVLVTHPCNRLASDFVDQALARLQHIVQFRWNDNDENLAGAPGMQVLATDPFETVDAPGVNDAWRLAPFLPPPY